MADPKVWFVEQRAEDLAVLLLTRFPVTVTRQADTGRGPDLRVAIDPDRPGVREFAVAVKGTTRLTNFVDKHGCVRAQVLRQSQRLAEACPFPLALMLFDVATDAGSFGWLLAPVIRAGKAGLLKPDPVMVEPASNERIARALSEVREWYSARPWRIDKAAAEHR